MTERSTLFDRVRAAYGLGEDGTALSTSGISQPLSTLSPMPPQLTELLKEPKVNSIRVPFDPEDQSDDEVVITSIYNRDNKAAKGNSTPKGDGKPNLKKTLSPEASIFQPKIVPLVSIPSSRGSGSPDAVPGKRYPSKRVPFCPWIIVQNYHSWFVGKQNGARIGPYFEKSAILKWQEWDFCYLWHPAKDKESTYVLMVPTRQFQSFLDRLNKTLNIQLTIPPGVNGDKFAVIFGQMKTPVPRFLGRAPDLVAFGRLTKAVPPLDPVDAIFELSNVEPRAREMFVRKVNGLSHKYDKTADRTNKSEKNRKKRLLDRRAWGQQIKRVQRYMGIREKIDAVPYRDNAPRYIMQSIDYSLVPPFIQEDHVIFVAMDIESYEFNHGLITELGFAILDTRKLAGQPPGPGCENWLSLIEGRHLRTTEYLTMVNRDMLAIVTSILQPWSPNGERRNVVLVGHDIKSDIALVKNIGFHVTDDMFMDIVDTQFIHQYLHMKSQQASLKSVLTDLEIEHYFLHNGGNDAMYTLQAMVRIVVLKREASLRRHGERMRPGYKPDPDIVEQGWESGGEFSDGTCINASNWRHNSFVADKADKNGTPLTSPSSAASATPQKTRVTGSPAAKTKASSMSAVQRLSLGQADLIDL
ncbi:hypothetical protein Sste5344_003066 [Sporothrix stenoceras]